MSIILAILLDSEAGAVNIDAIGVTAGDININAGDDIDVDAVGILRLEGATIGFFSVTPGTAVE